MESREEILIIGICDDDKKWLQTCNKILIEFATFINVDLETRCFSNSEELLAYKEVPLDAIFLDIELGKKLGISVAKELNRTRPNCRIVYMTNYLHYATEIYNTEHIWFVVKKDFRNKVGEIIHRIMYDLENKKSQIVLKTTKNELISIIPSDICYMEKEKRGTRIVTVWKEYYVKERLDDILPQLSELDFSQCHHSYAVNFRHVKELQRDMYILYGQSKKEQIVQISRRYVKKTREDFLKWSALFV